MSQIAAAKLQEPTQTKPSAADGGCSPGPGKTSRPAPGHPLQLSRALRVRLYSAVRTLLDTPELAGVSDAVRLSALVLVAKARFTTCRTQITTRELGRWIGMSESTVDHAVLPALRAADDSADALRGAAVQTRVTVDQVTGQTTGLEAVVMPVWRARNAGDAHHPLVLSRVELVQLLRLMEALFAPGWGASLAGAGLLADRRGRGAATDRLALVLLVLRCGADGRVRLGGGAIPKRVGRSAVTLARELGCSASAGANVLSRLRHEGVIERVPVATRSGLRGRTKLIVPAVQAAHYRRAAGAASLASLTPAVPGVSSSRSDAASPEPPERKAEAGLGESPQPQKCFADPVQPPSAHPAAAPGVQPGLHEKWALPEAPAVGYGAEDSGLPHAASLHSHHAVVDGVSGSLALSGRLSGEAAGGQGDLPECAYAPEDQAVAGQASSSTQDALGPLRGEHQIPHSALAKTPARWLRCAQAPTKPLAEPFARPLPSDLVAVLEPVRPLWDRLSSAGTRRVVSAAVRLHLAGVAAAVGPQQAERVLAKRLQRRLDAESGRPVHDPVGWLSARGLPQRQECYSILCDEGRRMDTGGACSSCAVLIADRRGLRTRAAAQARAALPGVHGEALRAATERHLRTLVEQLAAVQEARREQTRARKKALDRRLTEEAEAEQVRLAAPCADCGMQEAAGLCLLCTHKRGVERLLVQAVDLAVVRGADLSDPRSVEEVTAQCEADTRALLAEALVTRFGEAPGVERVLFERELVEQIRDQRQESLKRSMLNCPQALKEDERVYEATMRSADRYATRSLAERAAETAAARARSRVARMRIDERMSLLRLLRSRPAAVQGSEGEDMGALTEHGRWAAVAASHDSRPTASGIETRETHAA